MSAISLVYYKLLLRNVSDFKTANSVQSTHINVKPRAEVFKARGTHQRRKKVFKSTYVCYDQGN